MYKSIYIIFLWLAICSNLTSQITVQLSTLPDVGDKLLYISVLDTSNVKVDNKVFQTGANLQWDFSNLADGIESSEAYLPVTSGTVADSFPEANIAIDFLGLKGFAKRNTTDISILGVAGDSIVGFPIPIIGLLDNPFIIRRAPFGYEDQFSTSTSFSITVDASVLDTIQEFQDLVNTLPGTTVDSLRVTLSVDRSEDVDGWGMVTIPSGVIPTLKVTQEDMITTQIEIYANTFAGSAWVNLSPFLPDEIKDLLTVTTTNHQFFSADKKEVVAEFTMAQDSSLLSTRYARDIKAGLFSTLAFDNLIEVEVFPNPTSDWVNINIITDDVSKNDLLVELHDITGTLIRRQIINKSISQLDLNKLSPGLVFLTIRSGETLLYRSKLMISKDQ